MLILFAYLYPIVPTLFVERMIISALNCVSEFSTTQILLPSPYHVVSVLCITSTHITPQPKFLSTFVSFWRDISLWESYLFEWVIFVHFRFLFKMQTLLTCYSGRGLVKGSNSVFVKCLWLYEQKPILTNLRKGYDIGRGLVSSLIWVEERCEQLFLRNNRELERLKLSTVITYGMCPRVLPLSNLALTDFLPFEISSLESDTLQIL